MAISPEEYYEKERLAAAFINDVLQPLYPDLFPRKPAPKVPLAVGFTSELLVKKRKFKVTGKTIRRAMKQWCTGWRYYKACSEVGANRYNLSGEVVAQISEEEAEYARQKLIEWEQKTAARRERREKDENGQISLF